MAKFESKPGLWPIFGWPDRSSVRGALAPHGMVRMFDTRVSNSKEALKEKGVEGDLIRLAYEDAMRRFGLDVGPEEWRGPKVQGVAGRVGRKRQNLNDDILWVYNALEGKSAGEAPSTGALGLLGYARNSPEDFYKVYVPRLMAKVDAEKQEVERFTDDGRPTDRLCDMIRERLHGVPQGASGESGVPALAERRGPRVQGTAG